MQIISDSFHKSSLDDIWGVNAFHFDNHWSHFVDYIFLLISLEQIRDLSGIQHVVHIFQECFIYNLSIREQETHIVSFYSSSKHQLLYEIFEVIGTKALCDFDLATHKFKHS